MSHCIGLVVSGSLTNESTARTMPKPKVYRIWNHYLRPKPNVYRKCSFTHIQRRDRNSVDL